MSHAMGLDIHMLSTSCSFGGSCACAFEQTHSSSSSPCGSGPSWFGKKKSSGYGYGCGFGLRTCWSDCELLKQIVASTCGVSSSQEHPWPAARTCIALSNPCGNGPSWFGKKNGSGCGFGCGTWTKKKISKIWSIGCWPMQIEKTCGVCGVFVVAMTLEKLLQTHIGDRSLP